MLLFYRSVKVFSLENFPLYGNRSSNDSVLDDVGIGCGELIRGRDIVRYLVMEVDMVNWSTFEAHVLPGNYII